MKDYKYLKWLSFNDIFILYRNILVDTLSIKSKLKETGIEIKIVCNEISSFISERSGYLKLN